MKTITLLLFFTILSFSPNLSFQHKQTESYRLHINFENIEYNDKPFYVTLYNSKEHFYQKEPFKNWIIIPGKQNQIQVDSLPKGSYAVLCFQDLNNNHRLDFDNYYRPVEPWGLSNNSELMGPPTWQDAKFEVNKDKKILIKLFN